MLKRITPEVAAKSEIIDQIHVHLYDRGAGLAPRLKEQLPDLADAELHRLHLAVQEDIPAHVATSLVLQAITDSRKAREREEDARYTATGVQARVEYS